MDFTTFVSGLKSRLQQALPGEEAQSLMAPERRLSYREYSSSLLNTRQSAVLVCIYPRNNVSCTVLMVRPEKQGIHSGQVSFPGGRFDEGDKDLAETALREAHEEIGINKNQVDIIGALTPLIIPVSGFHVQPFIGVLHEAPVFELNPSEALSVIEIELSQLSDKRTKFKGEFHSGTGMIINAPYYEIAEKKVWGATAMILSELEKILESIYKK